MEITSCIDRDAIIDALTDGYDEDDPIKFVIDLDAAMADEGFTENLLLALAQSYEKEYTTYEEHVAGEVLESTFVDAASAPERLDNMRSNLTWAMSKRNKLSQIVALIKSLDDDDKL
jgi:hypothetical protein